jgi:hypothetical protein
MNAPSDRTGNLTYPNAHCPVCGASVFFFQDRNGGRVFFDPPLGVPWSLHPCTTNRDAPVIAWRGTGAGVAAVEADAWYADALERPSGTVLRVENSDEVHFVSASVDLTRHWLSRVWPELDAAGEMTAVTLMESDTANLVTIPTSSASDPGPLSPADRTALAANGREKARTTIRRVRGIGSRVVGRTPDGVPFAAGLAGATRVICIHVPADHIDGDEDGEQVDRLRFATAAAKAALASLAPRGELKPDPYTKDLLVLSFDDPFGYLERWIGSHVFDLNDRHALDFDYLDASVATPLQGLGFGHVLVVDAGTADEIEVDPVPVTIDDLLRADQEWVEARIRPSPAGRWSRLTDAMRLLGLAEGFATVDRHLKKLGWRVNHGASYGVGEYLQHDLELQYLPGGTLEGDRSSLRLLYSMSDRERGMAFVAVPWDHAGDDASAGGRIRHVSDTASVEALVADLAEPVTVRKRKRNRKAPK